MNKEKYRELVIERIRMGHSITLRKANKKMGVKAAKQQVPGCLSKVLLSKTMQNKLGAGELALEAELMAMRKERIIICTNGIWWVPA